MPPAAFGVVPRRDRCAASVSPVAVVARRSLCSRADFLNQCGHHRGSVALPCVNGTTVGITLVQPISIQLLALLLRRRKTRPTVCTETDSSGVGWLGELMSSGSRFCWIAGVVRTYFVAVTGNMDEQTVKDAKDETIGNTHLYSALRLQVTMQEAHKEVLAHATGFIVSSPSGNHFLVTNRHVVDPSFSEERPERKLKSIKFYGYFQNPRNPAADPVLTSLIVSDSDLVPVYPYERNERDIDIAVIKLPEHEKISGKFNCFELGLLASRNDLADFQVHVSSPVIVPGYPGSDSKFSDRPIMVSGSIASDPRFSSAMQGHKYPYKVLCHSFSREGMSGAPVLGLAPPEVSWLGNQLGSRVALLGINTGHSKIDNEPSVMTQFHPAPMILSTIAKAGDESAASFLLMDGSIEIADPEDLWSPVAVHRDGD